MGGELDAARPKEPALWARELGVSKEAVDLYLASDVIHLHLDTFLWHRILRYDLARRHRGGLLGRAFYGHTDLPRAIEAGLSGATWVITTNPYRPAASRLRTFFRNLDALKRILADASSRVTHVRTVAEYRAARAMGKHAAFIGVQGGNALDHDVSALDRLANLDVVRVTIVHLTNSGIGATSAPALRKDDRLTELGVDYVRKLDSIRTLVDLAHIGRKSFFDAVRAHDRTLPLIVTHTGIDAVHPHWRNLTDPQIRAIADSGGTIGIMLQSDFLARAACSVKHFVDHVEYVIRLVGDDHVSLGSDFDGMIVPPADVASPLDYPRVVQEMLRRGMGEDTIRKFLSGNFLRVVEAIRG